MDWCDQFRALVDKDQEIWKPTCSFCGYRGSNDAFDLLREHIVFHSETLRSNSSFFAHVILRYGIKKVTENQRMMLNVNKRFWPANLSDGEKKKILSKDAVNQPILFTDPIITKYLQQKQLHQIKAPLFTHFANCIEDLAHLPPEWQKYFLLSKLAYAALQHGGGDFYALKCPDCDFQLPGAHFYGAIFLSLSHLLKAPDHNYPQKLREIFLQEWHNFIRTFDLTIKLDDPLPKYSTLVFDDFLLDGYNRELIDEFLFSNRAKTRKHFVYFCAQCFQKFSHSVNFVDHCAEVHGVKMHLKFFGVDSSRLANGAFDPITFHWFPLAFVVDSSNKDAKFKWACGECGIQIVESNIFALILKSLLHFYFEIYIMYAGIQAKWMELCLFMNCLELKFRSSTESMLYANSFDISICDLIPFMSMHEMKNLPALNVHGGLDFYEICSKTVANFVQMVAAKDECRVDPNQSIPARKRARLPRATTSTTRRTLHCQKVPEGYEKELERYKLRFCLDCEMTFLIDGSYSADFEAHFESCSNREKIQTASDRKPNKILLRKLLCDIQRAVCTRKSFLFAAKAVREQPSKQATKAVYLSNFTDLKFYEMPPKKLFSVITNKRKIIAKQLWAE